LELHSGCSLESENITMFANVALMIKVDEKVALLARELQQNPFIKVS